MLQARLHRNFQDHNTQLDCDLIALGDLSIGRIGATYSQNPKTLEPYDDSLDQSRFPVVRGLALSRDDLIRCTVIEALMCQGQVSFESIELACLIDLKVCFGTELIALQALARQGLVLVDDTRIQIASTGWFFVRAVAIVFDRYLQTDRTNARFSKII